MNLNSTRKNIGKCQLEAFLWNSFFFYLSHLLFSSEHPTYQLMRKLKKKGPTRTSSVPFSSVAKSCITLCDPMNHSMPGLPVHHQLSDSLNLMSIESVMPSSHLILCCPLLLVPLTLPSIRVFSYGSALHMRWPKYWSFSSASVFPMNTQD